jgi:hypothetical protein
VVFTRAVSDFCRVLFRGAGSTTEEVMGYALLTSNRDNMDDPIDAAIIKSCDEFFKVRTRIHAIMMMMMMMMIHHHHHHHHHHHDRHHHHHDRH